MSPGVGRYSSQPAPFSHHGHVSALGIGYRDGPTSYERAAFAGLPATTMRPRDHITDMGGKPQGDPKAMAERLLNEYRIRAAQLTDCSISHR